MMENERVPREAMELMALAEREPIEDALLPLDPERLADARAGGGAAWGVTGHGVMSWRFRLVVRTAKLDIDITRPALRVLSDEAAQAQDAAEIRSACRLAALAICRAKEGHVTRLSVTSEDAESWSWCLEGKDLFRAGGDFAELVELLADCDSPAPLTVEFA